MVAASIANVVTDASDWLGEFSANWWFLGIILTIAYLDSIMPIVPGETMVIIGGVAAGSGDQNLLAVIAAGAIGAFLGDNTEAVSVAYWRVYGKYFEAKRPYRETHLLTLATLPSYHVYNARRPLAKLADFEGVKIRAAGALANAKIKALGAIVVPAQVTQFAEMISKGIVDGTYFTDDGVRAFGFLKYLKFKTHFPRGLSGYSVALVMNKRKWDSLSAADKAAISKLAGEPLSRKFGASFDASVTAAQDAMKQAGVEVTTADAALMAEVTRRFAPIEAAWIAKAKKLGVDGAAALKMLRDEAAAYKPMAK